MKRERHALQAVAGLFAVLLSATISVGLGLVGLAEGGYPPKPLNGNWPQAAPAGPLILDDEFLFHPSADVVSIREKIATVAPALASNQPAVGGDTLDLAGMLVRAASGRDYDINPYLLLSLLVASGSLNPEVRSIGDLDYALNYVDPAYRGVQAQLIRMSHDLARAFWARKLDPSSNQAIHFNDGQELVVDSQVNAGTYAVQAAVARTNSSREQWEALVAGETPRFRQAYLQLADNAAAPAYGPAVATAPFLRQPFNGSYGVNSWFDHEYPNYSENGTIVAYTGERRTGAGVSECTLGYSCYDGHSGIDFNTARNPVIAAASGNAITFRNYDEGNGCGLVNAVLVVHGNGYVTKYWHLGRVDIPDGWVQEGTQLGLSGSTGCATGPHLHFAVTLNNVAVDPYGWSGSYPDPWSATSTLLWKNNSPPILYNNFAYFPLIHR